ncbi:MAG: putative Ig domain-containing protein [Deltaproteobacteria bacterium]|nr:putative Ig domain-containing protein [Deltaproteobacteria bacterium]
MFRNVMIFLLAVGLIACSQQADNEGEGPTYRSVGDGDTTIRSVWIEPANPTSTTNLTSEVLVRGEPTSRLSYQWLRNNVPIPGAIRPMLPSEQFSKGDFVSVQVRVAQAGADRDPVTSDPVLIGNTPPVVDWVSIGPAPPSSTTSLEAVAKGSDLDNDKLSFSYQWTVSGEPVVGQEGPTLASNYFKRGDQIEVTAVPYDGTDWGQPGSSVKVTISNSPPIIKSTPPGELRGGTTYRYQVQAEDADGDTLTFSLQGEPPKGMVIDSQTGVVEWQVVIPEKPVTYVYEVVVEDPEGAKSIQTVTLKSAS